MKAHHKENTIYTVILIVVLAVIAGFALQASKALESFVPPVVTTSYPDAIAKPLEQLNIKESDIAACVQDPQTTAQIDVDTANAGGTGTPLFYIYSDKVAYKIVGALPADLLSQIVDAVKKGQDVAIPPDSGENFQKITLDETNRFILPTATDATLRQTLPNPSATIVEYGDLSCPACKYAHSELKKMLVTDSNVQYVYRHHPLTSIHPDAYDQAKVAICLQKTKGIKTFWDFIDLSYQQ